MTLIDDLKGKPPVADVDRRKALGTLTTVAMAVAGGGTAITMVKFMRPAVVFEPPTKVGVGRPQDVPVGALLVFADQKLYVAHTEEGFFAMSSVCTHLGCMTRFDEAKHQIFCPCHGSQFDAEGKVVGGPAPKPLVRRKMFIENGLLVVDTRVEVGIDDVLKV